MSAQPGLPLRTGVSESTSASATANASHPVRLVTLLLAVTTLTFLFINIRHALLTWDAIPRGPLVNLSFLLLLFLSLVSVAVMLACAYIIRATQRDAELRIELQRLQSAQSVANELREQRHDFLNHLTVVSSLLQMNRSDRAFTYLRNVYHQKDPAMPQPSEHPAAVEVVLALLLKAAHQAQARGVQLQVDLEVGAGCPDATAAEFTRILGNLLDNAFDAVTQTGPAEPRRIVVEVAFGPGGDRMAVSNTGTAIPPADLARVFQRGYSTKGGKGERGIGLHVVQRLVRNRGGNVRVTSTPEQGTRFEVNLPRNQETPAPAAPVPAHRQDPHEPGPAG